MTNDNNTSHNIRWYDRDEIVSQSMNLLKDVPDSLKRQVATYLVEEIIARKPYIDMLPFDTHYLILSENRRRRWYDYDETVRIFVELLRHTSDDQKRVVCLLVLSFVESLEEEANSGEADC